MTGESQGSASAASEDVRWLSAVVSSNTQEDMMTDGEGLRRMFGCFSTRIYVLVWQSDRLVFCSLVSLN